MKLDAYGASNRISVIVESENETEALQLANEYITGMVRCFLGFPSGGYYKDINKEMIGKLRSNKDYCLLNKEIPKYLDNIRKFRNDSVHSGFRSIDLSNEELCPYDNLLDLAKTRFLRAVEHAIINDKIQTLLRFKK